MTTTWKAEQVKELRETMRLTQEQFAALLSMSRATVIRWEAGEPISLASQRELDKLSAMEERASNDQPM